MTHHALTSYIDQKLDATLAELQAAMDINSHSKNRDGVNRVQDILSKKLSSLGFSIVRRSSELFGDQLLAENPVEGRRMLLVAHADTVHPIQSAFQSSRREGDRIIGPGGYDMKAGIFMGLLALEALQESGQLDRIPIRLLVISDEEIGMPDSASLHNEAAEGCSAALVLESGRADNMLVLTRKGIALCEAAATGIAAHSGNDYWSGANAVVRLAHAILALSALSDREKGITLNVGSVQGGAAATVVPNAASMRFDIRSTSLEDFQRIWSEVQKIAADTTVPGTSIDIAQQLVIPPMEKVPGSDALAEAYLAVLQDLEQPGSVNQQIIGGASSGCLLSAAGLPTIDSLGPFGEGEHTDKEWFSVESFRMKAKALALLLLRTSASET